MSNSAKANISPYVHHRSRVGFGAFVIVFVGHDMRARENTDHRDEISDGIVNSHNTLV